MLSIARNSKYFKVIEYIFFVVFWGLSIYFMYGVLEKFFAGKTSISQSEEYINMPCHKNWRITSCGDLKVKVKVKVTSSTSPANLLRPGMAGLPALIRPNFHFKNVIFDQNGLFLAPKNLSSL